MWYQHIQTLCRIFTLALHHHGCTFIKRYALFQNRKLCTMSWYLHGVRQFSRVGGNCLCSQPVPHLQFRLASHYLQKNHLGNCSSVHVSMCQIPRCIFSTLCVVRSDPHIGCSSYRLRDASVCLGTRMSCRKHNVNWCSKAWSARSLMTTPTQQMFWERDPKGGYGSKVCSV